MAHQKPVGYSLDASPPSEDIVTARVMAGHTQTEAGRTVHRAGFRAWQRWEAGDCPMPLDAWELYILKTGQHPSSVLKPRR